MRKEQAFRWSLTNPLENPQSQYLQSPITRALFAVLSSSLRVEAQLVLGKDKKSGGRVAEGTSRSALLRKVNPRLDGFMELRP